MAYPVKVWGHERGWWARTGVAGFSTTFLGCVPSTHTARYVNGVVYEVTEQDLLLTDAREMGYRRALVPPDQIEDYVGALEKDAQTWVYLNDFPEGKVPEAQLPNKRFPIVQSYIDVCLNGCLAIEAEFPVAAQKRFAIDFIQSTLGWNGCWVNDRIYPRRPFVHVPNAFRIDQLLKDHLADPTLFDQIYFE